MTESTPFRGIFTIPSTPFREDGEVDVPSFRRVVDFCVECGAHGLYWHESRNSNWVLFELIQFYTDGEPTYSDTRAHFAHCGADVAQDAPAPAKAEIDAETREAIHEAIRCVAEACDGAMRNDGQGFSKFDSRFGRDLARASSLSNNMAHAGRKMIKKYRRQLDCD